MNTPPTSDHLPSSSSTHNRDPPSFPTRRSSDLDRFWNCDDTLKHYEELRKIGLISEFIEDRNGDIWMCGAEKGIVHLNRSEEHTSELQSRLHLVCRLLLEKKKSPADDVWPQQTT